MFEIHSILLTSSGRLWQILLHSRVDRRLFWSLREGCWGWKGWGVEGEKGGVLRVKRVGCWGWKGWCVKGSWWIMTHKCQLFYVIIIIFISVHATIDFFVLKLNSMYIRLAMRAVYNIYTVTHTSIIITCTDKVQLQPVIHGNATHPSNHLHLVLFKL